MSFLPIATGHIGRKHGKYAISSPLTLVCLRVMSADPIHQQCACLVHLCVCRNNATYLRGPSIDLMSASEAPSRCPAVLREVISRSTSCSYPRDIIVQSARNRSRRLRYVALQIALMTRSRVFCSSRCMPGLGHNDLVRSFDGIPTRSSCRAWTQLATSYSRRTDIATSTPMSAYKTLKS